MRGTTTARNGTHPRPVRVLTVDDQPLFRDAARAVVSATPGFEPLAEVGSGEDALALLDKLQPGRRAARHQPAGHRRAGDVPPPPERTTRAAAWC